MARKKRDAYLGPQPDEVRESLDPDDPTGTDYSSRETPGGTEGFTGGGSLKNRPEFTGRPNLTEERQNLALDPDEPGSVDVERGPAGDVRGRTAPET